MLAVRDLSRPGLAPAALDLAAGECLAIQGPSGSGKTLLLRAIADLDPNDGAVILDGTDRNAVPAPQWRRQVVYVAAEPGWWVDTVEPHFLDWDALESVIADLGLPPTCRTAKIATLSTGERLRLALARALERGPRVLMLDEPTAALDRESSAAIETLIAARRAAGAGVLWVTHDDAQARRVADGRLSVVQGVIGSIER